ncbi:MAG: hypothetical protein GQ546_11060 [Gammaproteobacteria bacterium]|nr:hypothetical protein [Gammaproteobacteria bacterium]
MYIKPIAGYAGASGWGRCKHIPVALNENIPVFRHPIQALQHTTQSLCHLPSLLLSKNQKKR